jgi:hypothetical protein
VVVRLRAIGFILLASLVLVLARTSTGPVLATPTSEATTSDRVRCSGRARSSRTAPAIATRGNDGSTALAFGARTTQPTIEDVGEARLANGSAYVPLDRAFAATVDPNAPYLAFVTAEGDTRGLYVAQLDARIFPLHRTDLKPLAPPARPAMLR